MEQDIARVLCSEQEIAQAVKEMGAKISKDYAGKDLILVCILKGAAMFYADLARSITIPLDMDFMSISSYGNSRKSSGIVQIRKDMDANIEGRHVLIVEDIVDSGQTLAYLKELLMARSPASLKICTLLDKPERRVNDLVTDYVAMKIPDEFVVGYGLDYAEKYRNLPYIGVLRPSCYGGEE
jgi:hypoxanthine phosphoribosyltransferase